MHARRLTRCRRLTVLAILLWTTPIGQSVPAPLPLPAPVAGAAPAEQMTDPSGAYYLGYYDAPLMNDRDWIIVANPTTTAVSVTVTVANPTAQVCSPTDSESVPPLGSVAFSFCGVRGGPVIVQGPANTRLIVSQRVLYGTGPTEQLKEMITPAVTDLSSHYWFPYYDDFDVGSGGGNWLTLSNPNPTAATATIRFPSQAPITVDILPLKTYANRFNGWADGPVEITAVVKNTTTPTPILASQRVLRRVGGQLSYHEELAVPEEQMGADQFFPWFEAQTLMTNVHVSNPDPNATIFIRATRLNPSQPIANNPVEAYVGPRGTTIISQQTWGTTSGGSLLVQAYGTTPGPNADFSTRRPVLVGLRILSNNSFLAVTSRPYSALTPDAWFAWLDPGGPSGRLYINTANPDPVNQVTITYSVPGAGLTPSQLTLLPQRSGRFTVPSNWPSGNYPIRASAVWATGPNVGKPAPIAATQMVFWGSGWQMDDVWGQSAVPRQPTLPQSVLFGTFHNGWNGGIMDPATSDYRLLQVRGSTGGQYRPFAIRTYTHWRDAFNADGSAKANYLTNLVSDTGDIGHWVKPLASHGNTPYQVTVSLRFKPPAVYFDNLRVGAEGRCAKVEDGPSLYQPYTGPYGFYVRDVKYKPAYPTDTLITGYVAWVRLVMQAVLADPDARRYVSRVIIGNEGNSQGCNNGTTEDNDGFFQNNDWVVERAIHAGVQAAREEIAAAALTGVPTRMEVGVNYNDQAIFTSGGLNSTDFLRNVINPPVLASVTAKPSQLAFLAGLSFVGMQAYPPTDVMPNPSTTVSANYSLSTALLDRRERLRSVGVPKGVRFVVTEMGAQLQGAAQSSIETQEDTNLKSWLQTICAQRFAVNLDEFDWFALADKDSSSMTDGAAHYGLLHSADQGFSEKTMFSTYWHRETYAGCTR